LRRKKGRKGPDIIIPSSSRRRSGNREGRERGERGERVRKERKERSNGHGRVLVVAGPPLSRGRTSRLPRCRGRKRENREEGRDGHQGKKKGKKNARARRRHFVLQLLTPRPSEKEEGERKKKKRLLGEEGREKKAMRAIRLMTPCLVGCLLKREEKKKREKQ